MLEVEILACEAQAELGIIPKEAAKVIREKANFDVERIHEIEKETNHDIISFVTAVGEYVGEEAKYIHLGLTSTDVKDTALGAMMKQLVTSFWKIYINSAMYFAVVPLNLNTPQWLIVPMVFMVNLPLSV